MGEANTTNNKVKPIFSGVPKAGVPLDLSAGAYSHAGTLYNPDTGRITCLFTSATKPAFDVSYVALNAKHGWVLKSDNTKITIRVLAG